MPDEDKNFRGTLVWILEFDDVTWKRSIHAIMVRVC